MWLLKMNSSLSYHVTDLPSTLPPLQTILYIASDLLKHRCVRSCHPLLRALCCALYFVTCCLWAPRVQEPPSSDQCLTDLTLHSSVVHITLRCSLPGSSDAQGLFHLCDFLVL